MKLTALTCAAVLMAGTASAATTAFTLDISGSLNLPRITLGNVGDLGDITGFTLSMGDTGFNFDTADFEQITGTLNPTLDSSLDSNSSGGLRADSLAYTFTGFNPGEAFSVRTDIDIDNQDTRESYIDALLPGGSIFVTFAGGLVDSLFLDLTRPAGEGDQAAYSYTAAVSAPPPVKPPAPVPLPAGLPLLLAGLGALGLVRRARS